MKHILLGLIAIIAISSCKKKTEEKAEFDKGELLENIATNIIVPSLTIFNNDLNTLKTSFDVFDNNKTQVNLELVKENWKTAYSSWQSLKIYDFGPLLDNGVKGSTGIFPSDTTQILNNIQYLQSPQSPAARLSSPPSNSTPS